MNKGICSNVQFSALLSSSITSRKGFTLIELLVVVLIIGILAAIAMPQYQKAVTRSKVAELITIVKSTAESEKRLILETGRLAIRYNELDIDIPGDITATSSIAQTKTLPNKYTLQIRNDHKPFGVNAGLTGTEILIRYHAPTDALYCTTYTTSPAAQKAICKSFAPQVTCKSEYKNCTCYGPL